MSLKWVVCKRYEMKCEAYKHQAYDFLEQEKSINFLYPKALWPSEITDHFGNNRKRLTLYNYLHISVRKRWLTLQVAHNPLDNDAYMPFHILSLIYVQQSRSRIYHVGENEHLGVLLRDVKVTEPTSTNSSLCILCAPVICCCMLCVHVCRRKMSHTATATA